MYYYFDWADASLWLQKKISTYFKKSSLILIKDSQNGVDGNIT